MKSDHRKTDATENRESKPLQIPFPNHSTKRKTCVLPSFLPSTPLPMKLLCMLEINDPAVKDDDINGVHKCR